MTTIPFFISLVLVTLVIATLFATWRTLGPTHQSQVAKRTSVILILFALVLIVQSILALNGFLASSIQRIPPPMGVTIIIQIGLVLYLAIGYAPFQHLQKTDTVKLALLQTFRFPLELIFIWLLHYNAIPVEMTFEGRNPDILIGLSAPLMALAVKREWLPVKALLLWNIIGLLCLINIMCVAILCLPTPFRMFFDSVPNEFVLYFPFNLVPSVFVMLALFLHVVSLKTLLRK